MSFVSGMDLLLSSEGPAKSLLAPYEEPSGRKIHEENGRIRIQLPHDILFLVFNEASCIPAPFDYYANLDGDHWDTLIKAQNDGCHSSYTVLTALCLVSKNWNTTATPLLYRDLRLKSAHQISAAGYALQYRHINPAPWVGALGYFVKDLCVGNFGVIPNPAPVIANLQKIIVSSPNLRAYRNVGRYPMTGCSEYGTKVVKKLVKFGGYITVLQIWDYRILLSDLNLLITGLPVLETLIIRSMVLLELQDTASRITSVSIRRLVMIEPDGYSGNTTCPYSQNFVASAMWFLPNLESVLIHDCCGIGLVLKNMAGFLARHQANLRQIVFRRWVKPISSNEVALLCTHFSGFRNVATSSTSVQFLKV